ncbi:MAG: epoxyqueuosine reductase QueH [Peptococcaceae bacterium]|nr:epoxyqueuosine reductase QueH [Peptococcaceae bacterium]
MSVETSSHAEIVLHSCCAPCSGPAIPRVQSLGHVTVFFSNSNIYPVAEYVRRRDELASYCARRGVLFVEDVYDPDGWMDAVKGLETEPEKGRRCAACFRYRLGRSAAWAKANGRDLYTTTLTLSPHKDSALLLTLGNEIAAEVGLGFGEIDFKKQDGFRKSLVISREEGFYRQNYCGCRFSMRG